MFDMQKIFGRDRRLPGDQNIVSEGYKLTEREQILRNATAIAFHRAEFMDGIFIDHTTRAATEVQQEGKPISAVDVCLLTLNRRRLNERLACAVYRQDEENLGRTIEAGRKALELRRPSDRALFDARLAETSGTADPAELLRMIEAVVPATAARYRGFVTASFREDTDILGQEVGDEAAADAIVRFQRLGRLAIGIPSASRSSGQLEEAAKLSSGAAWWVEQLVETLAQRIADHRNTVADRRGDLLRSNRLVQAEQGSRLWKLVWAFFRNQPTVHTAPGQKERTARECIEAIAKERICVALEAEARSLQSQVQREVTRTDHALDLADAKVRRGVAWDATVNGEPAPIRGICLEDMPSLVHVMTAAVRCPDTLREISRLGDAIEQTTPSGFSARVEETVRAMPEINTETGINGIFALLDRGDQDAVLNRLLTMPSVPLRRIPSAIWRDERLFACPGGPSSSIWQAAQRQPNAARYRVSEFNDLPDTAVASVWVKFIRPAELEAYREGRDALEQISPSVKDAMAFYAIPALAEEADPTLNSAAIDELIVKGIATGVISSSRPPAIPPFYFVNGHSGGRPVHSLPASVKRQLPKLGDTLAQMSSAMAINGIYRAEVVTAWVNRLTSDGASSLASQIRSLLAQDVLNSLGLRQAAGRVVHQLERGSS